MPQFWHSLETSLFENDNECQSESTVTGVTVSGLICSARQAKRNKPKNKNIDEARSSPFDASPEEPEAGKEKEEQFQANDAVTVFIDIVEIDKAICHDVPNQQRRSYTFHGYNATRLEKGREYNLVIEKATFSEEFKYAVYPYACPDITKTPKLPGDVDTEGFCVWNLRSMRKWLQK